MSLRTWIGLEEKHEEREGYSDAVVRAILASATQGTASVASTAALESCAGLVGRSFASAKATGARSELVTPGLLMLLGRSLIKDGEAVLLIEAGGGGMQLFPASAWTIKGNYNPASWMYDLTLAGPTSSDTKQVGYQDVIHCRINSNPNQPWKGCGAADSATLTSDMLTSSSVALSDEAASPRGTFVPVVGGDTDGLGADIKAARGSILIVDSQANNFEAGGTPPTREWESRRFGADPPDALLKLQQMAGDGIMAAIGISASIFRAETAASALTAFRHFNHSLIGPLGRLTQTEFQEKLDAPDFSLDFSDLRASDVQARAASFKKLVESGIEVERALALSGLLADENA